MKFKYSAVGDNTQENREWLEKLGYEPWSWIEEDNSISCISTMPYNCEYGAFDEEDFIEECFSNDINCINNPQLFQAVTAIREDSDCLQWFVIDRINGATEEYVSDFRLSKNSKFDITEVPLYGIVDYHKATLEELQHHFKTNKK